MILPCHFYYYYNFLKVRTAFIVIWVIIVRIISFAKVTTYSLPIILSNSICYSKNLTKLQYYCVYETPQILEILLYTSDYITWKINKQNTQDHFIYFILSFGDLQSGRKITTDPLGSRRFYDFLRVIYRRV